jgi:hypothetical protein
MLEGGVGVGFTRIPDSRIFYGIPAGETNHWGPGGPVVGIGAFLNQETAILLRLTGTWFETNRRFGNRFVGLSFQHWKTPRLAFGAGAGLAAFGSSGNYEFGAAFQARTSYALIHQQLWGLHGTVEVIPANYRFGSVISAAALLEMQWY